MKTNLIQMLTNTAISACALFVPLLAKYSLNLDVNAVGLIGAVYGFSVFISSYISGRAADFYDRKRIISVGLAISSFAFLSQAFVKFIPDAGFLIFVRGLAGFSIGISIPALSAYVYESRYRFGLFLAFGSLGYGLGSGLAGSIALYLGDWVVFLFTSLCLFAGFILSLSLPDIEQHHIRVPLFPKEVIRKGWPIYLGYFLRHTGANSVWIIFSLYMHELGANYSQIGILTAVNAVGQFFFMNMVDRWDSKFLIHLGTAVSVITFIVYTIAPSWEWLIPGQIMISFAWSCMYVGSNMYLLSRSEEHATASGLLQSSLSLAAIIGPLIGGAIAGFFADELEGYRATMYFAAVLSTVAFLMFFFGIRQKREKYGVQVEK